MFSSLDALGNRVSVQGTLSLGRNDTREAGGLEYRTNTSGLSCGVEKVYKDGFWNTDWTVSGTNGTFKVAQVTPDGFYLSGNAFAAERYPASLMGVQTQMFELETKKGHSNAKAPNSQARRRQHPPI
jgi:hypothetical protein